MKTQLGSYLQREDQRAALASYVHRFTVDHKPTWAQSLRPDGRPYQPQFASDANWLVHTEFQVRADGRLDRRAHHCNSSPTWPLGQ